MKQGKIIIISAPSGCGKSTIINAVAERGNVDLKFSVSATNRPPREGERNGVNYYFMSTDEFVSHIERGDFVEYEEVYPGRYYGTLKSEIERRVGRGENVILDIDVCGGVNVKQLYPDNSMSMFIQPPSIEALRARLSGRGTESEESLKARLGRAEYELTFMPRFDVTLVNDNLNVAVEQTERVIAEFLAKE